MTHPTIASLRPNVVCRLTTAILCNGIVCNINVHLLTQAVTSLLLMCSHYARVPLEQEPHPFWVSLH